MFTQWFFFQLANFVVQILRKSNYFGKKGLLSILLVDGTLKQHKIKCLFSERYKSLLKVIMSRQSLIVKIDVVMYWLLSNHLQHQGEDELFTGYSILVAFYWLLVTFYSLLVDFYLLLITTYSLLVTTFLLLFTCYSLLFTCYSVLRYSLLLIRYSLLFIRHYLFVNHQFLLVIFVH